MGLILAFLALMATQGKKGLLTTFFRGRAVDTALNEFKRWNYGQIKEGDPKTMPTLRNYWIDGAGVKNWTDSQMITNAWSAAFISWVMKTAGAGTSFPYSTSHSVYITKSIKNKKENNSEKFKGYRIDEVAIQPGDLVCYARQSGVGYDTTGQYMSHCDLVMNVTGKEADTIGGNVSNSVSLTKVVLLPDGKIDPKNKKGYFVVIKNSL